MASLDRLITEITTTLRVIQGLEDAPAAPVEGLTATPALIVYANAGRSLTRTSAGENGNEYRHGIHTLTALVSVARQDIARDLATLMPFADLVPARLHWAFAANRFGGIAVCLGDARTPGSGEITYELTADSWWVPTIDLKFSLTVTVEEEVL